MPSTPIAIPTTIQEANALLLKLNFPVPAQNLLRKIGEEEGVQFRQALADAAGEDASIAGQARDYVVTVLSAYSPKTAEAIRAAGMTPQDPQTLLPVLKQEGRVIRSAISAILKNPSDSQAASLLCAHLGHICPPSSQQSPASTPEGGMQSATNTGPQDDYSTSEPPADEGGHGGGKSGTNIVSAHLYGKQAAFCFSVSTTLSGDYPTVNIDAAKVFPGQDKKYDWKNKIVFQLTVGELPLVYGVLMGFMPELRLVGHGKANNKTFSIKDQGGNYYLTLQMGKESMAIPAYAKDTFRIMLILKDQMNRNAPRLSPSEVSVIARRVCRKHVNPAQRQNLQAAA